MEERDSRSPDPGPVECGAPWPAWETFFLHLSEGVLERLPDVAVRRAFHGGTGLVPWLSRVLARPDRGEKHFVAVEGLGKKPAVLVDAARAGRVLWLDRTDPLGSLRAFPGDALDLVALHWPAGTTAEAPARPLLDAWLAAAHAALAPGRPVAVWVARDGSPEPVLRLLRAVLRGLARGLDLPPGPSPDDDGGLRDRLERAGFGAARAWREGLSLAFPDAPAAVEHFARVGGERLLAGIPDPPVRAEARARLVAALAGEAGAAGEVVLGFEVLLGIGVKPPVDE